jgi:hypothetical protein
VADDTSFTVRATSRLLPARSGTTARLTNFPWQAVNEVIAEAETLEEGYMNSNTIFAILEYIPVYEFVTYLKLVDC